MREDDPRARRTRVLLWEATARLLADDGPGSITVDAVARVSGVARTTVYRHYPDLADLVVDAVAHAVPHGPEVDTGAVVEDLVALLLGLDRGLTDGAWAALLPGLLLAARQDPRTSRLLASFVEGRRQYLRRSLERGRQRGELRTEVDADVISDLLAGAVYYRHLVRRVPTGEATIRQLVEAALRPARSTMPG